MEIEIFVDFDCCEKGNCKDCSRKQQDRCIKDENKAHKKGVEKIARLRETYNNE